MRNRLVEKAEKHQIKCGSQTHPCETAGVLNKRDAMADIRSYKVRRLASSWDIRNSEIDIAN